MDQDLSDLDHVTEKMCPVALHSLNRTITSIAMHKLSSDCCALYYTVDPLFVLKFQWLFGNNEKDQKMYET